MRLRNISIYVLSLAGMLGLWSCSADEEVPGMGNAGKPVPLTITVSRDGAHTRTELSENAEGGLSDKWLTGDELKIYDGEGKEAGTLRLKSGEGANTAVFSGELTSGTPGDYSLWYLGQPNKDNTHPRLSYANNENVGQTVTINLNSQEFQSAQELSELDIMNKVVSIVVNNNVATVTEDVIMNPVLAMVRFSLKDIDGKSGTLAIGNVPDMKTLPLNVRANNSEVGQGQTSNGINAKVTEGGDVFVAMVPGISFTPKFTFTSEDGKVYTCEMSESKTLEAGKYYCTLGGAGSSNLGGIEINLTPQVVDDAVGPVLTINGKRWRFTRGNLYYNTTTGVWGIHEKQTDFTNAGGLGISSTNSLNGTPELIGLFAWGATGLEDAQLPTTLKEKAGDKDYSGWNFPSTLGSSKNSTIKDLLGFDNVYDWGRAYKEKGRAANDSRDYITPPRKEAFEALMESCFVQGCTIKGAGPDGGDVTGLIAIPGSYTLAEAKAFINSVEGASCLSSMVNVYHNNSGNTFNYKYITLESCDVLKKLNDAVFFPAASKRNLTSGKVYDSDEKGWYWTASTTTSTNAYDLYFDGEKGGFFYNGNSQGSMSRNNQMAVRLLVEVIE